LGREFDIYRVQRRTDCYCGPVCEEITKFIVDAEAEGCGPW
jgi:hypothetical protein